MSGLSGRLPHPSGANVDEPRLDVLLQLTYNDGVWALARAEVDEDGQVKARRVHEIPFELAQQLTEAAGVITAEVVRRNHLKYAEALEAKLEHDHARTLAQAERALAEARALKERMQPRSRAKAGP